MIRELEDRTPSPLGNYVGGRLMTDWTAMLNVYGAEESPDYEEYDQSFDGNLPQCLEKLSYYQQLIDDNGIDAYLSIQPFRGSFYSEGDLERILEDLLDEGFISQNEYDKYARYW